VLIGQLLAPAAATAGVLYGTVRAGNGGPAAGVNVLVACPSFEHAREGPTSTPVDGRGSFTLRVQANGRCEMRVTSGRTTGAPFPVFSSQNSLRYDFRIDAGMNRVP
jgi:hypothetical protein